MRLEHLKASEECRTVLGSMRRFPPKDKLKLLGTKTELFNKLFRDPENVPYKYEIQPSRKLNELDVRFQ